MEASATPNFPARVTRWIAKSCIGIRNTKLASKVKEKMVNPVLSMSLKLPGVIQVKLAGGC